MFDNWVKAHEFEFAASGILIGIGLAIVGVSSQSCPYYRQRKGAAS